MKQFISEIHNAQNLVKCLMGAPNNLYLWDLYGKLKLVSK